MKRRRVLQLGAALGGGLLARKEASARGLGRPLGPYGQRSPFEKGVRWTRESKTPEAGSSFTPLAESHGILTPSSLHYVQPTRESLIAVRGTNSGFHYNGIKLWKVAANGSVTHVEA